jgi:Family of unknown function (DUF1790).
MGKIIDLVVQFFEKENWQFSTLKDESSIQTSFTSDQGTWMCVAQTVEDDVNQRFYFYSICPIKAQDNLMIVAEFITRVNYGLSIGNFELDFSDGEIRFKTSVDITEDGFGLATVERLVYTNVLMMDRYLPGLISVLTGQVKPIEAIQLIEVEPEAVPEPTSSDRFLR